MLNNKIKDQQYIFFILNTIKLEYITLHVANNKHIIISFKNRNIILYLLPVGDIR